MIKAIFKIKESGKDVKIELLGEKFIRGKQSPSIRHHDPNYSFVSALYFNVRHKEEISRIYHSGSLFDVLIEDYERDTRDIWECCFFEDIQGGYVSELYEVGTTPAIICYLTSRMIYLGQGISKSKIDSYFDTVYIE